MIEEIKPKVLIVEQIKESRELAKDSLVKAGWTVVCEDSTIKTMETLQEAKASSPFVLIISGVRMPDIDGDEILIKAGKISPNTQRMAIIPVKEQKIVIRAINMAHIHACLSYPFTEEDLVSEADTCCKSFLQTIKRQRYKRLVKHQYQQLFVTAQKFKKKEIANKQRINNKKTRILHLKSQKRKLDKNDLTDLSLNRFIELKKMPGQPEIFFKEFEKITKFIKSIIKKTAKKHSFDWDAQGLHDIISSKPEKLEVPALVTSLKKLALIDSLNQRIESFDTFRDCDTNIGENTFDHYLELVVSDDYIKAWFLKKKKLDKKIVNLASILDFLLENHISYGIVSDEIIEKWIDKPYSDEEKVLVAEGKTPIPGKDGKVTYYFKTDYTNTGRILEDGSIDFRDRGEVPFVKKNDKLASLQPGVKGAAGIDLNGEIVEVGEMIDPLFQADSGTLLAKDGLNIVANADGQPHVDAMGSITVNEELVINENVDFKTGNIHFEGNIVVKGVVKSGFIVKGVSLTAKEIEGATIELSGDLNVSQGITNAKIKTVGNIYTKFINNCTIYGFGNFIVQKEIIDSSIWLSGSCQIPTGQIIASSISAKQGIEAKKIGTHSSQPSILRVGLDDHIDWLEKQLQADLEESLSKRDTIRQQIRKLNKKEREMHKKISDNAYIQDRSQIEIQNYEKKLAEYKAFDDKEAVRKLEQSILDLSQKSDMAETDLSRFFELQDELGLEVDSLNKRVIIQEEKNVLFIAEKKHLRKIRDNNMPDPKISVSNTIVQGTRIKGPESSLILSRDESRCMIRETKIEKGIIQSFEMLVTGL